MKLAFSTLGCPGWDVQTIVRRAAEYGYAGVDFRGIKDELDIYKLPDFSSDIESTIRMLCNNGVLVSGFSTSIYLLTEQRAVALDQLHRYAELCARFQAPGLRVFGGKIGCLSRKDAVDNAADFLRVLAEAAEEYGVKVLVETHDDWTSSEHVKMLIETASHPAVGVVWDMHHTWRESGESFQASWDLLGPWISNTHWKDSVKDSSSHLGFRYCLPGEGELDFEVMQKCLIQNRYAGWYTLEWEKRWHPEMAEPEVAFSKYSSLMQELSENCTEMECVDVVTANGFCAYSL